MTSQPGIDKTWQRVAWRVAGGYFWYYAAIGAFVPYIALYLREVGFSGLQIGVLTAIPSIGVAFAGPIIGAFADATGSHRLVLKTGLSAAAALALLASTLDGFVAFAAVMVGIALALSSVPSLIDSYAVTFSERAHLSYGSLRVWGSLGYTVAVLVLGQVMGDRVSSMVLIGYAALLALSVVTVWRLPMLAERRPQPLFTGMRNVADNRPLVLLLLVAFLVSTSSAVLNIYLGVHLEGIGGSASLIGFAFALSSLSELPVVALGGWFLRRLGAIRLASLAIVVYVLRFVAFSAITTPELALGVQVFHGLSYGAFLIASVSLAHQLAQHGQAATAQAMLTAMSFGFGSIVGSLVAGALLDAIGTDGLFRASSVLMAVALVVLIVADRRIGFERRGGALG